MSATVEDLDFLAPAVAGMPESDKLKALEMAEAYRPACLPEAKQDKAQLLYAAWLLYGRLQQQESGVVLAGVKSLKEGDLAVTYGTTAETSDPLDFYGRWKALSDLCGYGAITVGPWRRRCC
ncbi:DUF4054 domain-containing protein [Pusillimonas caeni]|uniref:DUF4054 domain-containing protein n=1 Tax=Pusillimonas caeni TaxID=1348472 RepID=UPI000E599D9B|nr:DUF4054 domain-containing protein [Pusillimonas caeni]TFL14214.1 DUF4054 domain-containing protein [Pusillimonas caeni]